MSSKVFPNMHGDLNVTDASDVGRSSTDTPRSPSLADDVIQPSIKTSRLGGSIRHVSTADAAAATKKLPTAREKVGGKAGEEARAEYPQVEKGEEEEGEGGEEKARGTHAKLQHYCSYAEEHHQDVSAEINSLSKVRREKMF